MLYRCLRDKTIPGSGCGVFVGILGHDKDWTLLDFRIGTDTRIELEASAPSAMLPNMNGSAGGISDGTEAGLTPRGKLKSSAWVMTIGVASSTTSGSVCVEENVYSGFSIALLSEFGGVCLDGRSGILVCVETDRYLPSICGSLGDARLSNVF
jgi:hypothetical protein